MRPTPPEVRNGGWPRNPIDRFVLARLEKEGFQQSLEADRVTLIRRLTLDLTGLPPTPSEVDEFVNDTRPGRHEQQELRPRPPPALITVERYDSFVLVNGHASKSQLTSNSNLALLVRLTLTDPIEDSSRYGRMIAELATTSGGGRPLVQRLTDLRAGRRSTWPRIARSPVEPTLREGTPGDLGMALPNRVVKDLLEALDRIDCIIEGINADGTLLYTPEIKFYETLNEVTPEMETTVPGFFVTGDAAGHSRGIIFAAVNGVLAADSIQRRLAQSQ